MFRYKHTGDGSAAGDLSGVLASGALRGWSWRGKHVRRGLRYGWGACARRRAEN